MAQSRNGPRKPATKFPHLRKQMQKNALPFQKAIPTKETMKFGQTKKKIHKP